jgi:hypothetical protein
MRDNTNCGTLVVEMLCVATQSVEATDVESLSMMILTVEALAMKSL